MSFITASATLLLMCHAGASFILSLTLQILNQFKNEGLEADLVDMQRYAAWKAADIRKALREGRTPTPGAPGGDAPAASTLTPSGLLHYSLAILFVCTPLLYLLTQAQLVPNVQPAILAEESAPVLMIILSLAVLPARSAYLLVFDVFHTTTTLPHLVPA